MQNRRLKSKKGNKIFFILLFLILAAAVVFYISEKNGHDFFALFKISQKQEAQKEKEYKSVAIYCQVHELSGPEAPLEAQAWTSNGATSTTKNFLIKEEQIVDRCVHIDESGVAFKEAPIISGGPFLVIYDKTKQDIVINNQAIKPEVLKFILQIKQKTHFYPTGDHPQGESLVNFTIISPISNDIEVLTSEGWKIYFDASREADKQSEILNKILVQKNKPTEYVDLRLENKAYFK